MKKIKRNKHERKATICSMSLTKESFSEKKSYQKGLLRDNRGVAIETIILIIIGTVAACIVGTFIFSAINTQNETGEAIMTQVSEMNQSMLDSEFTKYEATEITGSQVINLIKKYEQQSTKIYIIVNNGRSETQYVYNTDLSTRASAKAKDAKNKADLNIYINPSATFLGEIIRDGGDVDGGTNGTGSIIGLKFTKQ